jgi:hypothetical protein
VLEHERHEQVAALDRVRFAENPLGSPEPSAGRTHLSSKCEVDAHPERRPDCARGLAGRYVGVMRALKDAEVLVVQAEHVGGRREQLEIVRAERSAAIGR